MNKLLSKIKESPRIDYLVIAALSLALAFFRIAHQSIWNDESISLKFAKWPLAQIWEYVPKYDLHPPLYYSVLHFWTRLAGESELAARGLSAIFFFFSALLVFYLAQKMFQRRSAAYLATVLFITNPFAVLYAQEVRSYSLMIFMLLVNILAFTRIMHFADKRRVNYALYFISSLILVYTNILSLFALAAHAVLVAYKKDWSLMKLFAALYGTLFLLYIPALRIISNANEFDYSYYNSERFGVLLKTVVVFSGFIGGRINILNGKWHDYNLLGLSLLLYLIIALVLIKKRKEISQLLLGYFLIAFVFNMVAAHVKFPVPDPKYFYIIFPAFILLVTSALLSISNRRARISLISAALLLNLVFLYNYYFVKKYEKENWKSVITMIESDFSKERGKAAVSISPVSEPHSTWTYYSNNFMPSDGATKYGNSTSSIERAMDEINKPPKDIIYLSRFIYNLYDPQDNIRIYLEQHGYRKTAEFKDTKVEYWRFDKINASNGGRKK